jgi:hypothetical protein
MAENKAKDDDKPAARKADAKKTFDCSACGGQSKDQNTCSECGTVLRMTPAD